MVLQENQGAHRPCLLCMDGHPLSYSLGKNETGLHQLDPKSVGKKPGHCLPALLGARQAIDNGWMQMHHVGKRQQGMQQSLDRRACALPFQPAGHHVSEDFILPRIVVLTVLLVPDAFHLGEVHAYKALFTDGSQGVAACLYIQDAALLIGGVPASEQDKRSIRPIPARMFDQCCKAHARSFSTLSS